ncbi:MAG: DNA methyltransferase [Methanosarcinales archaeon Met12]|nr:MAG: DNA methyltransferase [Methanosarcinales archaeon Met12]
MMEKAEEIQEFWAYDLGQVSNSDITLLDNVQFIYELSLAQLELKSLDVDFEATNGLREFKIANKSAKLEEKIRKRTAYCKSINKKYTDYFQIIQRNRTRSVNQYLTHWIYPYKGKFHPQMIRALLNIIGLEQGDTVLDPFIGSGTTALEAQLLGINCVGIDISPLCVLQSKVKVESIDVLADIINWKERIRDKIGAPLFNTENKTLDETIEVIPEEKVRNFYRMARLVAISDNARRGRNFSNAFLKNLEMMVSSVTDYHQIVKELDLKLGEMDIKVGDSRKLPLDAESIDGIITSPPYSIALDYVVNDAHALKSLGYNLPEIREEFIGVRGKGQDKVNLYNEDMKQSYNEMYRILKPQKFAVIVIGNATYQGRQVKTVEFTIDYMEKIGFKLVRNINKIIFGLYNVMKRENILIFQKTGEINHERRKIHFQT